MKKNEKTISIQNILYERNQKKSKSTSPDDVEIDSVQKEQEYKGILEHIQQIITTKHATELAEILNKDNAKMRLTNLIVKYLNQEKLITKNDSITELSNRIYEDMAGLAFLSPYLEDPTVEEINLNGDLGTWVVYPDRKVLLSQNFNSPAECANIIKKMAHMGQTILDGSKPYGDSYITKGIRMSGAIAPVVDEEHGGIASIRKQKRAYITKERLLQSGAVTEEMLNLTSACVNNGISVGFIGATSSGKTANMNYILSTIDYKTRIITIEDTKELQLAIYQDGKMINDVVQMYTRDGTNPITMLDLLKLSLRLHPEIIVPAEMRGAEALTVQEAGRTGHTIVSSLHANGAIVAYDRILTMCLEAGSTLSEERLLQNIVEAFPVMVFCRQLKDGSRKWMEIFEAQGVENKSVTGKYLYKFQTTETIRNAEGQIEKIIGDHKKISGISEHLKEIFEINGMSQKEINQYT